MDKMLTAFAKVPTLANARRLVSYLNKHPMAECFAISEAHVNLIAVARRTVQIAKDAELLDDPNYVGSRHHY
jgi:hypothetical protein